MIDGILRNFKNKKTILMVDRIVNFKKIKVTGYKKVNLNDWFFKSHFIDEPTMPGTLQIEAMLQTTVYLIYKSLSITTERCIISNVSTNLFNKINKSRRFKNLFKNN